jgi:hypothetical protein
MLFLGWTVTETDARFVATRAKRVWKGMEFVHLIEDTNQPYFDEAHTHSGYSGQICIPRYQNRDLSDAPDAVESMSGINNHSAVEMLSTPFV